MKRKLFIFYLCIMSSFGMKAQVMEWVIKPTYKDIVPMGGDLYKVKGSNGKWGIYNVAKGEQTIVAEYDSITPLVENRALILDKTGLYLYGIVSESGSEVLPLKPASQEPDFVVMPDYPYYSEGLLVVGQIPTGRGGNCLFGYVDKQGKGVIAFDNYYACPFNNGLAMVWTKKKTYRLINKQGASQYQGNEDVRFISNPKDGEFLLVTGNKIRKARMDGNKFKTIKEINTGGRIVDVADATRYNNISCRGGDTFRFDKAFHYIENGSETNYSVAIPERSNSLTKVRVGRQYGLNYNSKQLLIEQFKNVHIYNDEYALVTLQDGTKGLLQYNPSGKITVSGPNSAVEFAHNTNRMIPVNVSCSGMYNNKPVIELTYNGTTEICNGNGQVQFPFYEEHSKTSTSTTKQVTVDMMVDKLNYGSRTFEVKSSHINGFKIGNINIPAYSDMNGSATVTVTVYAINGTPSSAAKATVNGITKSFNGHSSLSFSIPVSVPQGGTKSVSINIRVTEDGCPSWTASRSGTVQHLSRK